MYQSRSLMQVQRSMVIPQQPIYSYPQVPVTAAPVMASYGWTQPIDPMQSLTEEFQTMTVSQLNYQPGYYASPVNAATTHQQYSNEPTYDQNSYGLPVNVSNGPVPSESREVHISNIQYKVHKRDMAAQISKFATPTALEYHVDHAGKFKGTAVATFDTGEDAARVVARLDKKLIKGKKVKVRLGKQLTPVTPAPLVLNGSYEASSAMLFNAILNLISSSCKCSRKIEAALSSNVRYWRYRRDVRYNWLALNYSRLLVLCSSSAQFSTAVFFLVPNRWLFESTNAGCLSSPPIEDLKRLYLLVKSSTYSFCALTCS
jgi:hypothetical protein